MIIFIISANKKKKPKGVIKKDLLVLKSGYK